MDFIFDVIKGQLDSLPCMFLKNKSPVYIDFMLTNLQTYRDSYILFVLLTSLDIKQKYSNSLSSLHGWLAVKTFINIERCQCINRFIGKKGGFDPRVDERCSGHVRVRSRQMSQMATAEPPHRSLILLQ